MNTSVDWVQLIIVLFFFGAVTVLGFVAARWRRADALDNLDEWGLGGRGFGTFIAWFLHRRRPLHGVHVHRRAGDAVRRQRGRLLRGAVHDRASTRSSSSSCRGSGRSRTGTAT